MNLKIITKNHVDDKEIGFLTKMMRNGDAANVGVNDPGLELLCSTNKVLALN